MGPAQRIGSDGKNRDNFPTAPHNQPDEAKCDLQKRKWALLDEGILLNQYVLGLVYFDKFNKFKMLDFFAHYSFVVAVSQR